MSTYLGIAIKSVSIIRHFVCASFSFSVLSGDYCSLQQRHICILLPEDHEHHGHPGVLSPLRMRHCMKSSILWDIMLHGSWKVDCYVRGSFGSACHLFHAHFLLGLFFDLEDGGDMYH